MICLGCNVISLVQYGINHWWDRAIHGILRVNVILHVLNDLVNGVYQVALIPYLTAGDPDLDTTAEAMRLLDACGADIIELGVPYSDPLADGPVIQARSLFPVLQSRHLSGFEFRAVK